MSALTSKQQQVEPSPSVRVIGAVKWFDTAKGYGFLIPNSVSSPELDGDVMLHISALRAYGETDADEGARIVCDAVRGVRGWQVENVIELERAKTIRPNPAGTDPTPEEVVVKWFSAEKGFGFVTRLNSEVDIFVHVSVLQHGGIQTVEPGDLLSVMIAEGPKGDHVKAVYRDG